VGKKYTAEIAPRSTVTLNAILEPIYTCGCC
jgi:hypothetical protein